MTQPLAEKRLIIVSGLSGAGKTIALHALEDLGYYCIDNLPVGFLRAVVAEIVDSDDTPTSSLAVGIDARSRAVDLASLPALIEDFKERDISTDVVFIKASQDILLKRYSESRRRHPLADDSTELRDAIRAESEMLAELVSAANLIIDTSQKSVYELAEIIRRRVDRRQAKSLSVLIESFGFKYGIPADADFVFDLRALPNPYWTLKLRGKTGLDPEVVEFLDAANHVDDMHDDIVAFLSRWIPRWKDAGRGYLTIAIGCTGGQHRSVYMAERVMRSLEAVHEPLSVRHSGLKRLEKH